ncbi:ESPR-type extended signal peptide-containing protein [Escherichia coli]
MNKIFKVIWNPATGSYRYWCYPCWS